MVSDGTNKKKFQRLLLTLLALSLLALPAAAAEETGEAIESIQISLTFV